MGVVVSVVLALFVVVAWCGLNSVTAPVELAMVNAWVEGGGLVVPGCRRRVLFV